MFDSRITLTEKVQDKKVVVDKLFAKKTELQLSAEKKEAEKLSAKRGLDTLDL